MPTLGNFVQKHAEAVSLNSNVAALFVCSDIDCSEKFETTECTINNVFTVNVYYKKVTHSIPLISQFQKATRYIRAHFKGLKIISRKFGKIDLVHHNILYPAGIIAWYLKKTRNIPYIITENWTGYLPSKNNHLGFLQKTISKNIAGNASCITPVSKDLQDAMIHHGFKSGYEIVYNVVDISLFKPLQNISTDRKIKFLHVSTLDDAHKNISGMLRVIAQLAKQRNDFECHFVGDGDTAPHISTAKQLSIYNNFAFFDGTKTTFEVAELMCHSNCFVLFSNYENLPCVMIEAFASGIPIVSSTVGGIPEHVSAELGLLVKPKDEKALLEALNRMIENLKANKYSSETLSNYAKENFSYEKVSEKFHCIYYRILKKNV